VDEPQRRVGDRVVGALEGGRRDVEHPYGGAAGVVAGAILGGLASVVLPGAGAAVAGGTILAIAMGGMTGGATGGVAGLLFGAATSRDHGVYYSQEVARGRTLVTVSCPPERRADASRILRELGAMEAAPMNPDT
jgi:hypothetical protein